MKPRVKIGKFVEDGPNCSILSLMFEFDLELISHIPIG